MWFGMKNNYKRYITQWKIIKYVKTLDIREVCGIIVFFL